MEKPKIAGTKPQRIELEAGKKYYWCSCGLSENQPFCDGKHKQTSFTPTEICMDETKTVSLCTCKLSQNGPICDGAHKPLNTP